jgi:hypothetical protein
MGVASLVLGITAVIFGVLPLIYTQLVGVVVGIIALLLGIWGRKQSRDQGQSSGVATTGLILGAIATILSGMLYATFIYSGKRVGDEMVRRAGSEMQKSREHGQELRRNLEQAIRQAHRRQQALPGGGSPQPVKKSGGSGTGKPAKPK